MSSIPAPTSEILRASAPKSAIAGRSTPYVVYGLVACAMSLFALTLSEPWWFFRLYAPQYPHGLTLMISLQGLSGDVREINMLNHYIGMAPLDQAAAVERTYAAPAVGALLVALMALTYLASRARSWILPALGALFPVGFVADAMFWLYRFGHHLDPHAPLRLAGFTPQLFGNGTIGQFMTFARPERGFWLAVAAVVLLAFAALVRARPVFSAAKAVD